MFSKNLAIDLGTSNSLVYVQGKGIALSEPSVVAINTTANATIAVGEKAKKMIGRTPDNIVTIKPIKNGVIADLSVTSTIIRYLISSVIGKHHFSRPRVIVTIPTSITSFERKTLQTVVLSSGAREAVIIEAPLAAAIGAGISISEPWGRMVVDIGGGTTDIAVLSAGGIAASISNPIAGEEMDYAIIQHIRNEHRLLIGERTAEEIKLAVGNAVSDGSRTYRVGGQDTVSRLSKRINITSDEIQIALKGIVLGIVQSIKICLEQTSPELVSDIIESGICLTGGGSLLPGIDLVVGRETGVAVFLADNPLEATVMGAGKALEDIKILRRMGTDKNLRR